MQLLVRQMLAKFQRVCLGLNRISVLLSFSLSADVYILLMAADGWHLPRCSGQKLGYCPGLFSCLFLKIEGFNLLRQLCSSVIPIQSNNNNQLLCLPMYLPLTALPDSSFVASETLSSSFAKKYICLPLKLWLKSNSSEWHMYMIVSYSSSIFFLSYQGVYCWAWSFFPPPGSVNLPPPTLV